MQLSINSQNITNKIDAVASVYGGINGDFKKWLGVNAELSFTNEIFNYNLLDQSLPNTIPTNGLVAYYPFNGNANDESGNNNNGTVNGATLTTDRNGNANKAYSFDGVDDYISAIDNNGYSTISNVFTISIWANVNNFTDNWFTLISKTTNTNALGRFRLFLRQDNYIDGSYLSGTFEINHNVNLINSWHHFVFRRIGVNIEIFIDNSLIGTISLNGSGFNSSNLNDDLIIGKDYWYTDENFSNGKIDDIRIYNRALLDSEIQNLFNE